MRWGAQSAKPGALNWVRPLHSIVATFGPETEEPDDRAVRGRRHRGRRRHARPSLPGAGAVQGAPLRRLRGASSRRPRSCSIRRGARDIILTDAKNLAFAQGLELVEDDGLLAEVAGLVEWPVVLMGSFDEAFLRIPDEVIRATIRNNQKCFVLRDAAAPRSSPTSSSSSSNIEAADGGKAIVAGNERVIRARLSDAKFFYETDLKTRLEDRLPKFKHIVFHEKLGTQAERIERIERLAGRACAAGRRRCREGEARGAALQGRSAHRSGRRIPRAARADGKILRRGAGRGRSRRRTPCEDHYKPKGPDDLVPTDPVSVAVALADKIDTLVGFWAIDEKPTGSKDPYALRRAALGVIRISSWKTRFDFALIELLDCADISRSSAMLSGQYSISN